MYLQQIGKITRMQFAHTEETVLDILSQRLKDEEDISVREYIRQKIRVFC
jgi:hypothetical protein